MIFFGLFGFLPTDGTKVGGLPAFGFNMIWGRTRVLRAAVGIMHRARDPNVFGIIELDLWACPMWRSNGEDGVFAEHCVERLGSRHIREPEDPGMPCAICKAFPDPRIEGGQASKATFAKCLSISHRPVPSSPITSKSSRIRRATYSSSICSARNHCTKLKVT